MNDETDTGGDVIYMKSKRSQKAKAQLNRKFVKHFYLATDGVAQVFMFFANGLRDRDAKQADWLKVGLDDGSITVHAEIELRKGGSEKIKFFTTQNENTELLFEFFPKYEP